jgi:hypothetical protein
MFDRIARSFDLARSSWNVLRTDKKLVLFPLISSVLVLIVVASFFVPIGILAAQGKIDFQDAQNNSGGGVPIWVYPTLFAFYFCTYFVIIFCNSALVSCAILRFNGEEPSLADGFRAAASRLPQIFAWALVSATVGIVLRLIENIHEKVGEILSAVLGTAWSVITFFVIPVLVVEKLGPFAAISRSLALLRKAWGEALVGNLGLGLFKLLLFLPSILIVVLGGVLCATVQPVAIGIAVVALGIICVLASALVGAALDTIFLAALYQYAAFDRVPSGFDKSSMEQAFAKKGA